MLVLFALLTVSALVATGQQLPPSCDSQVYCTGPLLRTVQLAGIFNDSKTFVDLKQKHPETITLENFYKLQQATNNNPNKDEIQQFVTDNFEDGNELESWSPPDFKPEPEFIGNIAKKNLREFATKIVALWKFLARKVKPEVVESPTQYSLIPLPNGFIIPGGRFKEIYYWDTYWIIRGLLISEMMDTARGMIENLMYLVKLLHHVPNGSRVYYTQRSQPPLLTKMVAQYMSYTKDTAWLKQNIDILETELQYFIDHRQVKLSKNGKTYKLYHYNARSYGPRPESYREDVQTAESTPNPNETYIELKSAAESGWDFSSRWIVDDDGGTNANLTSIQTRRIIPVDLNSFLYDAFNNLAKLYKSIGNIVKSAKWKREATKLEYAINLVLWNEKVGVWQDLDLELQKHRNYFYVSNLTPLWVNIPTGSDKIQRVVDYLKQVNIEQFLGGTPTSLDLSGEQWDMPNAWPPLQAIIIQGLQNSQNSEAQNMAEKLAQRWVRANYIGFSRTGEMFEKYDANVPGQFGGGGEYTVQAGFGWSNGVVLEFLDTYGKTLDTENCQ